MRTSTIAAGWLLAAACAGDGIEQVAVEQNQLGIATVTVEHLRTADGRVLSLTGYDASGNELATARVFKGRLLYTMDGADDPVATQGMELSLAVGRARFADTAPTQIPYVIRQPLSPQIRALVELEPIAHAIEADAGITFAGAERGVEVPYQAFDGASVPHFWPINRGSSDQACVNWFSNTDEVQTVHKGSGGGFIALRHGHWSVDESCHQQDGSIGCTDKCYYGPCRMHVDGQASEGYSDAIVFHSADGWCGWDVSASTPGTWSAPYDYTNESQYGGMTPTCPYVGCNADGTPF